MATSPESQPKATLSKGLPEDPDCLGDQVIRVMKVITHAVRTTVTRVNRQPQSKTNPISQAPRATLIRKNTQKAIAMSSCAFGRSPTENCVGWHSLTEEKYVEKKAAYEARKAEKAE